MDTIVHTISIHEQYIFDGRRATPEELSELRMRGFRYAAGSWMKTTTRFATQQTLSTDVPNGKIQEDERSKTWM